MAARRKRTNQGRRFHFGLLAGFLCLAAVSSVVWGVYRSESTEPPAPTAPPSVSVGQPPVDGTTAVPERPDVPRETVRPSDPIQVEVPGETAAPEETLPPVSEPGPESYDYSQPVPQSEEVPEDYFSDAAFIGDSRTDGLLLYSGIKGATGLSYKGLMVSELEDKRVKFTVSGVTDTVMGALEKDTYGKVYMMLGVNELGWYNDQKFYETYTQEVQRVKELQPGAVIYLQSILPVTQEKSDSHAYFTNENIVRYNGLIAQVAEEQQVFYLDVASALMEEGGALPAESSTDGIHLKRDGYKTWYQYLRNHAVTDPEGSKGENVQ